MRLPKFHQACSHLPDVSKILQLHTKHCVCKESMRRTHQQSLHLQSKHRPRLDSISSLSPRTQRLQHALLCLLLPLRGDVCLEDVLFRVFV